jgi:hypothetical protein
MLKKTTFKYAETKVCPICGNSFEAKYLRTKYCSTECSHKAWVNYINERMKFQRAHRFTPEMMEKMKWLKDNQQFTYDIIYDECWVCGSKENLLWHEVRYQPECVSRILCKSCHEFLHKSLLRRKKCRPIRVRVVQVGS